MTISRRVLLASGAAAGVAAALEAPWLLASDAGRFANALRIPAILEGSDARDGRTFNLAIASGRSEFLPGVSTSTIGINGSYLGPTIRCRVGDRVILRVKNDLAEETALHWHGLHIPARHDGGPHQLVAPGSRGHHPSRSSRRHRYAGITRI